MAKTDLITQDLLKEHLHYDPETGLFRKIKTAKVNQEFLWKETGSIGGKGYLYIRFAGFYCLAHRLAWLYVHGSFPNGYIDHINGDKTDNRISNLRDCSNSENLHNTGLSSRNTSGYKGVSWSRRAKKYRASIKVNSKYHYLGSFDSAYEAHLAYIEASKKMVPGFGGPGCALPLHRLPAGVST